MCPDYTAFGITLDGAHAEYVRIPREAIVQGSVCPLPDGLPFAHASLIEPLSCVVNGNRACQIAMGETVVVFGAGPIGLMHLMLAQLCGAARVIAVDPDPGRLAQATELGATAANPSKVNVRELITQSTGGRGADVAVTACSIAAVQEQVVELMAPFGRVCFFGGLPKDGSLIRIDSNTVHYKQLILTGTTGGAPRDFRTAMELLAAGRVKIEGVISHRYPTRDMATAFDTALRGPAMKVVVCREEGK
jgi:L-iditol 2-dehydrogenase